MRRCKTGPNQRLDCGCPTGTVASGLLLTVCVFAAATAGEIEPDPDARPRVVTVAAVGDVMCHAPQRTSAWDESCRCYRFDPVFEPVRELLSQPDLTIANLETTLPGDRRRFGGYPLFGAPDALAQALRHAGVDIVALANNHILDRGKKGLRRTLQTLAGLGLHTLGAYAGWEEWRQNRFLVVEKNGIRLALLNYTYGTNGIEAPADVMVNEIDRERIAEDLELARREGPDAILVLYHFGEEYQRLPNRFQTELVQFTFENGADVVLGSHPHVVQPFDIRVVTDIHGETKARLVAYSLGNFVSAQRWRHSDGGIVFSFQLVKGALPGVSFRQIRYDPIWVHLESGQNGIRFRVLPVREYLENNLSHRLSETSHQRMLRFHRNLEEHLKEGREKAALFNALAESAVP